MKLSDYNHIVWDFNGTLLDDVAIGIASINCLLSRRGLPIIPDADRYREIFGFPVEEYYIRAGFDFSKEPYTVIAHEWVKEYRLREKEASVRMDAKHLMKRIFACRIPQTVISASEAGMLREQLEGLGLLPYLESAEGMNNIYAASKSDMAKMWAENRLPGRVLMIGDTEHDAETAGIAGFDLALVLGGHSTYQKLAATGYPVFADFTVLEKELFS